MRYFLLILALLVMATPAYAADVDTAELDELSVTATKVPRKTSEVSASVDVVTKDEIEQTKAWNVGEAIGSLPGVQAESKNGAYDTHIIIRGAGAKAAYGVREIMIMVDGVPVTDPDSFTRLDMVDTSDIERIEVVKGPNSTLYGANAAGGVINIITKNPMEAQGLNIKLSHGSYNSEETHVQYGGNSGDLYYVLSGTRRSTDSWREHNKFDSHQLNGRFSYILDDSSDLTLSLSYTESDLELPGNLTKEEFDADHTQQASSWIHMGRYSTNKRLALGYNKEFTGGNDLIAKAYMQDWYHYHPVPYGINDGGAVVSGLDLQLNIPSELMGKKSITSVGVSGQRDDRASAKYTYRDTTWNSFAGRVTAPYSDSDIRGDLMEADTNIVDKYGVFVQESIWLGENTILDVGLRHDVVDFDLHSDKHYEWDHSIGNYAAASDVVDIEESWKRLSPRLGINHALSDGMHVYGAISTGFQTPTQSELETNLDLDPQKSVNYELGLKGSTETGHRYEAVAFHTKIEDEVLKLVDFFGTSYYDNAGETVHQGLELSGVYRATSTISIGANYTYSDFYFDKYEEQEADYSSGFPPTIITHYRSGNQIPLIPEHKYTAFVDYRSPEGFYGRLSSNTWGEYYVDTANSETYDGFTVLNAKVGHKLKNRDFYLQAGNILDKKYAAEVGSSYGKVQYSPAPPFTITAGVSVKL